MSDRPLPHLARSTLQPLRELPSVGELLSSAALVPLIGEHGREAVGEWVRQAIDEVRAQFSAGAETVPAARADLVDWLFGVIVGRAEAEASSRLGRVINATGVVLHTSLGRAPLSKSAMRAIEEAAGACNLEVDLSSGERAYRGYQLQAAWRRLTGAESALVVNNNAAATVLMLDALCRGREVVLSRGQLIEIGGSFRLPEIFAQSGAILREVGTTNRTRLSDYERAIGPNTAAILRVHPSNYRVVGFSETPEIGELSRLAQQAGVLCLDDLGSGCLTDTTQFGLPHEPTFAESLAAGADLVLGSGDKLLGGPQCGILLGRSALLSKVREHPLARAVRVDKLTLAALTATLDAYLRGTAMVEIPTLILLATSPESLHSRALQIMASIANPPLSKGGAGGVASQADLLSNAGTACDAVRSERSTSNSQLEDLRENPGADTPGSPVGRLSIAVSRETSVVGGGSLPGATLPTAVLRLKHATWSADELARRLRLGTPRLFGRIRDDDVLLDLRSVLPENDSAVTMALRAFGVERTDG